MYFDVLVHAIVALSNVISTILVIPSQLSLRSICFHVLVMLWSFVILSCGESANMRTSYVCLGLSAFSLFPSTPSVPKYKSF